MSEEKRIPYKVSLHGGHSGQFCDHAKGTLREMVEAAITAGMPIFGLSEHCPRYDEKDLFPSERELGFDVNKLIELFESYSKEASLLQEEYKDKIELLRGFEIEVVDESYYQRMTKLKTEGKFDYIVGSLHHLRGRCIDGWPKLFYEIAHQCGGLEPMAVEYYKEVQLMIEGLKPEVVGHIDLLSKFCDDDDSLSTPKIQRQMRSTLESAKAAGSILDLNVYPFRKGKKYPYPAPWIVKMALEIGVPFCFGDDSHSPDTVGVGIEEGRNYLLEQRVTSITALTKRSGRLEKLEISLV